MVTVPLGGSDWKRTVAQEPNIPVRNRYFEQNPTNLVEGNSLISRPGFKRWKQLGGGPVRGLYSQPGSFEDALFLISEAELYRIDTDDSATFLGSGLWGNSLKTRVSMSATGSIGSTPEMLYLADGIKLWLYMANSFASAILTASGPIAAGYKVQIDTFYYEWTAGSVDAGTPDGSLANPWLIAIGSGNSEALTNLALSLTLEGSAGSSYSTNTAAALAVGYRSYSNSAIAVQALTAGAGGNSLPVSVVSGANITWSSATLSGGGLGTLAEVAVPDDLAVVAVTELSGYVIVIVSQTTDYKGRFFWIEPGENFIRPLNFATAEQRPDPIHNAFAVGDQLWLLGTNSTETWYPTGDLDTPFARTQGQVFDRGTWTGTGVHLKENLFIVDNSGAVYNLGGGLNRISTPGIEQRIREAIELQIQNP